jgi:hypothetical protein
MGKKTGKSQGFFSVWKKMFLSISKRKTSPVYLKDVWFLIYYGVAKLPV